MSLEHALLNRLEARSVQLAQMKKEIHGLKQLVDEKMTINEQLSEQITSARLEREQMQHQIAELKTERDWILEISKNLVPKSALKQAMLEAAELHGALNDAQGEIQNLRAEVPLESTREALKNTVAKLQDVTTDRDRLQNEIVRLNAKLGPLEKLYEVVKKHVDHGAIIDNRADIYDAVAETAKALSQLTA